MYYKECYINPKEHISKDKEGKIQRWIPIPNEREKINYRIFFNSSDGWLEDKKRLEE